MKESELVIRNGLKGFLVFLVLGLQACSNEHQLDRLGHDSRILAFGDSLTEGKGVSKEHAYPAVLEKMIGLEVINAGVSGELSTEGLKRLPSFLEKFNPQLVIICHGGNDILRNHNLSETKRNLGKMIEMIQESGAQVVLLSVPQKSLFLSPAGFYAELGEEYGVPVEGSIMADLLSEKNMKSDSVHLNEEGYKKVADALAILLNEHGALP